MSMHDESEWHNLFRHSVSPGCFLKVLHGNVSTNEMREIKQLFSQPVKKRYVVVAYQSEEGYKYSVAWRWSNADETAAYTVDEDYPEYTNMRLANAIVRALNGV